MSAEARLSKVPFRFDNRTLLRAVRTISLDLARRTSANVRNPGFSNLLSDILGQSHFATIEVLAQKRRQSLENLARKHRESSTPSSSDDLAPDVQTLHQQSSSKHQRSQQFSAAQRDKLVQILRTTIFDPSFDRERQLTIDLLRNPDACDVDALRRLWDVPRVVFDVTRLGRYFAEHGRDSVLEFFDSHVWRKSRDARVFNILYWKECCVDATNNVSHSSSRVMHPTSTQSSCCYRNDLTQFRTISKSTIIKVIKNLLLKRRSPFFERNMDIVIETVLFAINPDRFVDSFRESALRDAGFFNGLQAFEYSRQFTGSMENLQIGKLNRMLKDIRAIRSIESSGPHVARRTSDNCLSLRAIRSYCAEQDSLTDRVLRRVYERTLRQSTTRANMNTDDVRLSLPDFVRMYLAWVGCWTDVGLRYWFLILDQDGDSLLGISDIAHFYSERKAESERRNGIPLVDVRWLWIRLCAMCGTSPSVPGLDLNTLKEMAKEEREFVVFALLARRADGGNLVNLAALASQTDAGSLVAI